MSSLKLYSSFTACLLTPSFIIAGVVLPVSAQDSPVSNGYFLNGGIFETINFLDADETMINGINDSGEIIGLWGNDPTFLENSFFRDADGNFSEINFPTATATRVEDINNLGQIVGSYLDTTGLFHGFLLDNGIFTTIDFPGASGTILTGINDLQEVVGIFPDADRSVNSFFRNSAGDFTNIDFPGSQDTFAGGINNIGNIVGDYSDSTGLFHGFILEEDNFTSINFPTIGETFINDINEFGDIVGTFVPERPSSLSAKGFLLTDDIFTTIDFPGAISTFARGINNSGEIVGAYKRSPEPSIILGILTTIGLGVFLLKPSKSAEKELEKVS
ncbi:hypothetical protein [Okeania sp. SIO2B3]|uniref:hypothetical protein n=1 Tax=Okeania sp. SIO2B3 TaxID=2607784 RepID=UPI0013C228DF|nr:hypothetical protein [Okeania sp. SIO2B3]NET44747.1 hypothetical protein [Okeania sp. SIO2B3]